MEWMCGESEDSCTGPCFIKVKLRRTVLLYRNCGETGIIIKRSCLQVFVVYENRTDGIVVEWKKTVHMPPHLHEAIEVVYVTDGILNLELDKNYDMDEGDFAMVTCKRNTSLSSIWESDCLS